jgi:hypothetical protein
MELEALTVIEQALAAPVDIQVTVAQAEMRAVVIIQVVQDLEVEAEAEQVLLVPHIQVVVEAPELTEKEQAELVGA